MCSCGQGSYYLTQMKDPAFLFYPNDWIGGTMGMTFEEKGAYMELLILQFNRGHMTTHMIGHMGNEDENVIINKSQVGKEGAGEKPNPEPPASEIPSLDTFLAHAKSFNDPVDEAKAIAMYEKWKKNGWNDSKGNPIKNWTALLKFNIPDLKPNGKKNQQNNTGFRTNR